MKSFTLIETIVAIAIFSVVLGAEVGLVVMGYKSYGYVWQRSLAIGEARRGVETMVKEIREAKMGDDGSYAIVAAENNEFAFFSDIDKDGKTERVRYFLSGLDSGSQTKQCVTYSDGGSCQIIFNDFLGGTLTSATVSISVEGDFGWGWNREYANVDADGVNLGMMCASGCSDCAGDWQGLSVFDVASQAADGALVLTIDASPQVNNICNWQEPNHSMKVIAALVWQEENPANSGEFRKGVIDPVGAPPTYPLAEEKVSILSSFVRNTPPIFEYFDSQGNKITESPARLVDTKLMQVFLIVNIDPNRPPSDFGLESSAQLRNLKQE